MNRFLKFLMIASIFLVPLSSVVPIRGTILWFPQFLTFLLIGFFALSAYLWRLNPFLSLLTAYSAFSYVFICHQHSRSLLCLVGAYLGAYFIYFVSKLEYRKTVYQCLIGFGLFQTLFVVLQALNLDPIFHKIGSDASDTVGFAGSHNQLGVYYAALAPFFLSIHFLFLIFSFLPIFFSKCSSALIGALVAVAFTFSLTERRGYVLAFCLVLTLLMFQWDRFDVISSKVIKERVGLFKQTIKQAIQGRAVLEVGKNTYQPVTANPFLGFGLGSFFLISPQSQFNLIESGNRHRYEHAHNDLVESLFDLGYIGFSLVVGLVGSLVAAFIRCKNKTKELIMLFSSLLAQGVASCGVYVVHAPLSFFMLCLTTGLYLGAVKDAKQSSS
jgi:hypothetical protein